MGKRIFTIILFILLFIAAVWADFTVQISAFKDESEAKTMVSDFSEKGYPVYYVRADLGEKGVWYRVRVGRFSDSGKAKEYGAEFKTREKLDFFVTGFQTPFNTDEEIPLNSSFSGSTSDVNTNSKPNTEIETYTDTGSYEVIVNPKIIDLGDSVIFSINDTETLPVIHTETETVKINTENDTSQVILSLNEVISLKSSDEELKERYKEFMADMEYADKIYITSRRTNNKVDLQRAYEVYRKIASEYFYIKEVYKAKYKMALCLRDLGKFHDSIQILKNIIPELSKEEAALIQYEIGFIYYHNLKEYNKALDELEQVVVHYPDTPWAKEAKDLIQIIMNYKIYVVDDEYDETMKDKNGD